MFAQFGIYVHFPWCRALCPYCDFAVAVPGRAGIAHDDYLRAVLLELADRAEDFAGRVPGTLYFGGGTPSLWQCACLAQVIAAVAARFSVGPEDLEITLEANPSDCSGENLAAWRAAGINRLSIGVQSTDERTLAILGRDHRHGDGLAAALRALSMGFQRVSADVIFGVPGSARSGVGHSLERLERSVAGLAESGVGHLSVYELTIEDRTRFGSMARRGRLLPLVDDELAQIYTRVHEALCAGGFEHYEISSYARPGQRSRHNQLYWHGGEYLGLGNGAASYRRLPAGSGVRTTNIRAVRPYLRAQGLDDISARQAARVAERLVIGQGELATEFCWLAMRTSHGVPITALSAMSGIVEWLREGGFVERVGDRLQPTLKGFLYADQVAARIVASGAVRTVETTIASVGESGYTTR